VNVGFSGGEQKKFELAQLLLFRPKFAVLDEIDMGLDTDGMRALEHVFSLLEHTTFLVITHARELPGFNPDQVHFFTEGKLVTSRVTGVRGREFYDQLSL
jgi:Fe-S cluster assembly ATP-binding protein